MNFIQACTLLLIVVSIIITQIVALQSSSSSSTYTVPDNTIFHIYYMQTTNSIVNNKLDDSYRTSLGFYQQQQGGSLKQFALEYSAVNGIIASLNPIIDSRRLTLNFTSDGVLNLLDKVDETVWTQREHIYSATGVQVNQFLCWLPYYIKNNPQYQLFHVFNSTADIVTKQDRTATDPIIEKLEIINSRLLKSSTSVDFVWNAMQILYSLKVNNTAVVSSMRNLMYLVVESDTTYLQPVNMQDITEKQKVVDQYSALSEYIKQNPSGTVSQFADYLRNIADSPFYLHSNGNYYPLKLVSPYLTSSYNYVTIPNSVSHYYERQHVAFDQTLKQCNRFQPRDTRNRILGKDTIIVICVLLGVVVTLIVAGAGGYLYINWVKKQRKDAIIAKSNAYAKSSSLREELLSDLTDDDTDIATNTGILENDTL
jgi:hypothetical protein